MTSKLSLRPITVHLARSVSARAFAFRLSPLVVAMALTAGSSEAAPAARKPAAAAPVAALEAQGGYYIHKAVEGDTLIKLANRYLQKRHQWQPLQKLNQIEDPTRIRPGTLIRIPVPDIRREAVDLKVLAAQGDVQAEGARLAPGAVVREGQSIRTGENGFVTVQLADGSTLTVQSRSSVKVDNARQLVNTGGVLDSVFRVITGRVEAGVERQRGPAARFEVRTDTSTMGVRGTRFRVSADAGGTVARGEVISGKVGVSASGLKSAELGLEAGFGTVVEAGKAPLPPVALLPAPMLPEGALRFERADGRVQVKPVEGARGYRAQVAADAAFKDVRADLRSESPSLALPRLPDGDYHLRVRAVDALGLEGRDADKPFTLAAEPVAPVPSLPKPDDLAQTAARFEWSAAAGATRYHLQVARDERFTDMVAAEPSLEGTGHALGRPLVTGRYHWRIASVNAAGKQGPWSDPLKFRVQAELADPDVPQWVDGRLRFSWPGDAGVRYQFQLASDSRFRNILVDRVTSGPEVVLDRPAVGVYYMRYRLADAPAGSPFSRSQTVDVYPLGR